MKNGVRQWAIASPTLFCIYLDTLLEDLRKSGVGCYIANKFMGAFGYADDIILIAPTRHSLQIMLNICEQYSKAHDMLFSTDSNPIKSKTKCMFYTMESRAKEPLPVILNGDPLPWVETAKHLGHILTTDIIKDYAYPNTNKDLLVKRAIYFDKVHSLVQEFGFCSKRLLCELMRIYSTSFYGSMIWSLRSEDYSKLLRSFNTAIKLIWDLPHQTHKNFIEQLIDFPHLQSMLHSRYIGFVWSVKNSMKDEVKLLYNICKYDQTSVTGSNLKHLMDSYELSSVEKLFENRFNIARNIVNPMSENDLWKVSLLEELVEIKDGRKAVQLTKQEIEDIIFIVTTQARREAPKKGGAKIA